VIVIKCKQTLNRYPSQPKSAPLLSGPGERPKVETKTVYERLTERIHVTCRQHSSKSVRQPHGRLTRCSRKARHLSLRPAVGSLRDSYSVVSAGSVVTG
jgi:hypothetical protein